MGTFIVLAVLLLVVSAIIWSMVKNKKSGKCSCSGCSGCGCPSSLSDTQGECQKHGSP